MYGHYPRVGHFTTQLDEFGGPTDVNYDFYKTFYEDGSGRCLVKRRSDGEVFLAEPWDLNDSEQDLRFRDMVLAGAGSAAADVLNHENLVSIANWVVWFPVSGTGRDPSLQRWYLLWDFADAGTLEDLLEAHRYPLPEPLVWHVGLSLLRALQWLHEGLVEKDEPLQPSDEHLFAEAEAGRPLHPIKNSVTSRPSDEWMPILHRNITPANVFLQRPRGIESFGAVKLGNFSACAVTGNSLNNGAPIISTERGHPDVLTLRDTVQTYIHGGGDVDVPAADQQTTDSTDRPYTAGNDLHAVGLILYRMMMGQPLLDRDRTTNLDQLFPDDSSYSWSLRHMVVELFQALRTGLYDFTMPDSDRSHASASGILESSWRSYVRWSMTPVGIHYNDMQDDIWIRSRNAEYKRQELLEAAGNVSEPSGPNGDVGTDQEGTRADDGLDHDMDAPMRTV